MVDISKRGINHNKSIVQIEATNVVAWIVDQSKSANEDE
jgi:hypothetical protein